MEPQASDPFGYNPVPLETAFTVKVRYTFTGEEVSPMIHEECDHDMDESTDWVE